MFAGDYETGCNSERFNGFVQSLNCASDLATKWYESMYMGMSAVYRL